MRIISGTCKGRRIQPPKNLPVRPTTDRAKEALFNILVHQYDFETSSALDLFAGTGSISYEFASRGVQKINAVDQNARCIAFIEQTAAALALPIKTIRLTVKSFLERHHGAYTFIFADPPYVFTKQDYQEMITSIFSNKWIEKGGLLIVEHAEQIDLSTVEHYTTARNYGGCVFSFFEG